MVHEALDFVHLLVQRTAEGDIHFLEATADAQHRNPGRDGAANQRQRRAVALGIMGVPATLAEPL